MDEETKIECYHGTAKQNEEIILKEGFRESKALNGHWLGRGIYFYKNIYYAIEWGIIYFINTKDSYQKYIEKCSIIKAKIDYSKFNVLDLNDPIAYKYYLEIINNIEKKFPEKINNIIKDGDIQIIRLIEKIEKLTGKKYISMFDILIADYPKDIYNKGDKKRLGDFLPCIQKQICVKNENVIKTISKVNLNTQEVEEYFHIIKKNREEKENDKQSRIAKKTIRKNRKYSK